MKLIFLDIDGVLNDHKPFPNGYNGMEWRCVEQFNRILTAEPTARIVLTSAWRYQCLSEHVTATGMINLFLTHGADMFGRDLEWTDPDERWIPKHLTQTLNRLDYLKRHGNHIRCQQIQDYICAQSGSPTICIIDDMPLEFSIGCFVRTDGDVGLTSADADRAIVILSGDVA